MHLCSNECLELDKNGIEVLWNFSSIWPMRCQTIQILSFYENSRLIKMVRVIILKLKWKLGQGGLDSFVKVKFKKDYVGVNGMKLIKTHIFTPLSRTSVGMI